MVSFVIKRDGSEEPFDSEKMKRAIEAASRGANLSSDRVNEVVNQVSSKVMAELATREKVQSSEIRKMVVSELDRVEPSASAAWKRYAQEKQRA